MLVNSAQTLKRHKTKTRAASKALKCRNPSLTTVKENYENQYERQAQRQLPRS